jgi:hypothetical protein
MVAGDPVRDVLERIERRRDPDPVGGGRGVVGERRTATEQQGAAGDGYRDEALHENDSQRD